MAGDPAERIVEVQPAAIHVNERHSDRCLAERILEALAHIRGEITLEELPVAMARSNRRYARRQLRWWRRDGRVRWFDIEPDPLAGILKYVE